MDRWNSLPDSQQAPALNGLIFGAVIGEEEYINKDGKLKVRQYIADTLPAAENPATTAPVETGVEECPF